jgi:hypothetical protein
VSDGRCPHLLSAAERLVEAAHHAGQASALPLDARRDRLAQARLALRQAESLFEASLIAAEVAL